MLATRSLADSLLRHRLSVQAPLIDRPPNRLVPNRQSFVSDVGRDNVQGLTLGVVPGGDLQWAVARCDGVCWLRTTDARRFNGVGLG